MMSYTNNNGYYYPQTYWYYIRNRLFMTERMRKRNDKDDELIELESYVDETENLKLLGDNPRAKVLTVLMANHDIDLSISEIARLADISRSTIYDYNILNDLEEIGVVVNTRNVGQGKMYQLNPENEVARKLVELDDALVKNRISREN